MNAALKIGEVAREAGIPTSALRYYESIGLLPATARSRGWRQYPPDVLERLVVIRAGRQLGFSLEDLKILLNGYSADTPPPARWRALASRKLPEIDTLIRRAQALKMLLQAGVNCQCVRIEDCFIEDCGGGLRSMESSGRPLPVLET